MAESKKIPRTELIKGHTHARCFPDSHWSTTPHTTEPNAQQSVRFNPFYPPKSAALTIFLSLRSSLDHLPESPLMIGPTGLQITNPTWSTDTHLPNWLTDELCKIHKCALIFSNEKISETVILLIWNTLVNIIAVSSFCLSSVSCRIYLILI